MIWEGRLLNIHIAQSAGLPMQSCVEAECLAGLGLAGDRYAESKGIYSKARDIREVTLIESETLAALARDHGISLAPHEHRRNLTTVGVPLNHLVGQRFSVGPVILEGGRLNTPCKYLERLLNKPVFALLKNRAGLNCAIVQGGAIRPGMTIRPLSGRDDASRE